MSKGDNSSISDGKDGQTVRLRPVITRYKKRIIGSLMASAMTVATTTEMHTSYIQSHLFHDAAKTSKTSLNSGDDAIKTPVTTSPSGPYNIRYGYAIAADIADNLVANGYHLTSRASHIPPQLFGHDLFPLYDEKPQAGLCIYDDTGAHISTSFFPAEVYQSPADIPDVITKSLLFVENRELGAEAPKTRNPVIEWDRFFLAGFKKLSDKAGLNTSQRMGASTLPTQLMKIRHSENGRTQSITDKFEQMLSASLSVYHDDTDTTDNIPDIIQDYLNSIPFAAHPQFGEVVGFADGMSIWFGNNFQDVNRVLNTPEDLLSDHEFTQYATYYRQSLALIMALQRPTEFLVQDRPKLEQRLDKFLPYMAEQGIISHRLSEEAMKATLTFNDAGIDTRSHPNNSTFKAAKILQIDLSKLFNTPNLYELRRIDSCAQTTLNAAVTDQVSRYLHSLKNPDILKETGLTGYKKADPALASDITYSITLYERTKTGNVLRVKADTLDGEFDINKNSKIEMGSTAKLRTLITYLENIEKTYHKYKAHTPDDLQQIDQTNLDPLTQWVITHLSNADHERSTAAILEASMNRRYSADHRERFLTNGGVLRFSNYKFGDYKKTFTVRDALQQSSNLPWVRILRDISNHIIATDLHVTPAIYDDLHHPDRMGYLHQFIAYESDLVLSRYNSEFTKHNAAAPEHILVTHIAKKRSLTVEHLAVIQTTLYPNSNMDDFLALVAHYSDRDNIASKSQDAIQDVYHNYRNADFSLQDKGYITGLHPLQLWAAGQITTDPEQRQTTPPSDILHQSYKWLLKTDASTPKRIESALHRQNKRIRTILERQAFEIIHESWERQGFPFDHMIPSYASALGSSADTPAAAANLIGILLNGGKHSPIQSFHSIQLATNTPYEQNFEITPQTPQQVISPEIAEIALDAIQGVVEHGTARAARNAVTLSDGRNLTIAGKTGTSDNEARVFNPDTGKVETVKKDRTAIFTFAVGDYHFGTVTAAVLDGKAVNHGFTSSLAVKLFKNIAPMLTPVLDPAYGITPTQTACAQQKSDNAIAMGLNHKSEYKIQLGDNLYNIAQHFQDISGDPTITVDAIQTANNAHYPNLSTPTLIAEKNIIIPIPFTCDL